MQIIISAVLWEKYLLEGMSQLKLVQLAAECGCSGVEFRPYWQDAATELPQIKKLLLEYGMIGTYACNECLLGFSEDSVRQSLAAMRLSLKAAEQLGASVLRINVCAEPFSDELLISSWWRQAVAEMLELAEAAKIVLALENPPNPAAGDPDLIHKIIETFSSPWLKATFDTGNWLPAGYKPANALRILINEIGYVHLKDMTTDNDSYDACHLGAGTIDFAGLVKTLTASGYDRLYVLEFPGGKDPGALIKASLEYLRIK